MAEKKHLSHIKSTILVDKSFGEQQYPSASNKMGKRPTVNDLIDGEIAVNFAAGHETITIRNRAVDSEGRVIEDGEQNVVGFLNENVTYENEEIVARAIGKTQSDALNAITEERVARIANDDEERVTRIANDDELDLVSAAGIAHLDVKKADKKSLAKTDADLSALTAKTDADLSALTTKTDADFNERDEIREDNENVVAAALSSIVGKSIGYVLGDASTDEDIVNLATLNRRVVELEKIVSELQKSN